MIADYGVRFISHLRQAWGYMWDRRVPIWIKLIPVLAVIYVLSPIDIIPDVLVGFGQLDDLGILLIGLQVFLNLIPKDISSEKSSNSPNIKGTKSAWQQDTHIEEGEFEEMG